MKRIEAQELLKKYRSGTLTKEEQAILESWYNQRARSKSDISLSEEEFDADLEHISKGLPAMGTPVQDSKKRKILNFSIAASVLLILSVGIPLYLSYQNKDREQSLAITTDIYGGGKRAILTLADNKQVVLDSVFRGEIARTAGVSVRTTSEGRLKYVVEGGNRGDNAPLEYNTISTPAGSEYQVQLSDGTVVWLNALSSIRFPTSFRDNERRIEVTGEVYLEVARNARAPFRVTTGDQTVEVLGTVFNIDGSSQRGVVRTTLVEGSIRVQSKAVNKSLVLKPGQQSLISSDQNEITVREVDLEEAVAWKNGYFLFVDDSLKNIMDEVSRWYDVEIVYERSETTSHKFSGTISRAKSLSQTLRMLELAGNVRFKIAGRRVVVMS